MKPIDLLKIAAHEYGLTVKDIKSRRRGKIVNYARRMAYVVLNNYYSDQVIAKMMNRDRTTITLVRHRGKGDLQLYRSAKLHYQNIKHQIKLMEQKDKAAIKQEIQALENWLKNSITQPWDVTYDKIKELAELNKQLQIFDYED